VGGLLLSVGLVEVSFQVVLSWFLWAGGHGEGPVIA
jgi:hypothetical protein